ncbi:hypothetical protein BDV93DRAFT_516641 [Ceratobasidium sp. AG-I]|nr:hypothetical protein BDV93DRAFT_516641 [Ceratobasidium sp. AG-I]
MDASASTKPHPKRNGKLPPPPPPQICNKQSLPAHSRNALDLSVDESSSMTYKPKAQERLEWVVAEGLGVPTHSPDQCDSCNAWTNHIHYSMHNSRDRFEFTRAQANRNMGSNIARDYKARLEAIVTERDDLKEQLRRAAAESQELRDRIRAVQTIVQPNGVLPRTAAVPHPPARKVAAVRKVDVILIDSSSEDESVPAPSLKPASRPTASRPTTGRPTASRPTASKPSGSRPPGTSKGRTSHLRATTIPPLFGDTPYAHMMTARSTPDREALISKYSGVPRGEWYKDKRKRKRVAVTDN